MSRPSRNSDPRSCLSNSRTFFVTAKCASGKHLLQSTQNATLFIDVLRYYAKEHKFEVHDFVVMPDHVHLLITVERGESIERTMQFIKGGFSHRIRKELGYPGEVWQKGFSESRVEDRVSFLRHREYIANNPVKKGLANSPDEFPFSFAFLSREKAAGARARSSGGPDGSAKAQP